MIITGAVRLPSCALSTLYTRGKRGDETECERRLDHGEVTGKGSFEYKIRLRKNIKVLGGWWHIQGQVCDGTNLAGTGVFEVNLRLLVVSDEHVWLCLTQ